MVEVWNQSTQVTIQIRTNFRITVQIVVSIIFIMKKLYPVKHLLSSLCFLFFLFSGTVIAQNAIVSENNLAGTPASQWDINGAGDFSIQGFATSISVNKGGTVHFKIKTTAS